MDPSIVDASQSHEEVHTVLRVPRPAITLLAGLLVVAASACSGSSATAAPVAPAGGGQTFNPQDPSSVITQVISGGSGVTSFHLKITVSGTIKAAALADAGSAAATLGAGGDMKLDGSIIEGDVDIANQAAHFAASLPADGVSADVLLVNNAIYYKMASASPKYTKMDLGSLARLSPVAIPTAGGSAMGSLNNEIGLLQAALTAAGVTAKLVGVEQIGGKDANHIAFSLPLDKINAQLAAAASPSPAPTIDSLSVDMWLYTADSRVAQLEAKFASSALGNLDLTLTVSAYNQPVTITAPSADQIQAAP
jgi:hypothetical protein